MNTDLDLRRLRYFVAVADTLNFGRAAEALMIAQPVLSRQIRVLEAELGVQLFVRDTRGTQLTEHGRMLRDEAETLLAAAAAVRRRVAVAARGETVFTVGFMPGLTVTRAVRAFRETHAHVTVEVMRTTWEEQSRVLLDGRADVSYLREPFDAGGIASVRLFTEPRVAMLPSSHPLAESAEVRLVDLSSEQLLQDPAAVPEWTAAEGGSRRGRAPRRRPSRTVEEKLELVAMGAGIAVLPLSTATFYIRPDVRAVPVVDLAETAVHLGWESSRRSTLVADFVAVASAADVIRSEDVRSHV
ncbi:LysR substrate-binding domain-containing protein [Leifsonia sp. 1010]|uniref:LysR family transcriptional regulator n=1 Tax=Leifsonia sp. 1010 TaxID=2817769 RepID=UPI002866A05A|nr:LysR substrate-binding domain-containing protein [Leifsonia sp. 1010]MDR6613322.1 DNA-binding transcriptional LysR family regulator [Leifsonia sp. 1010]